MARGGLSSDPEKRARQLAGLKRGAQRAAERLTEIEKTPAVSPAKEKPKPGDEGFDRLTHGEPEPEPGSRRRSTSSKPGSRRRQPRKEGPVPGTERKPVDVGFKSGLLAPFTRSYD